MSPSLVFMILQEYMRAIIRHALPIEFCLQRLVVDLLIWEGKYYQLCSAFHFFSFFRIRVTQGLFLETALSCLCHVFRIHYTARCTGPLFMVTRAQNNCPTLRSRHTSVHIPRAPHTLECSRTIHVPFERGHEQSEPSGTNCYNSTSCQSRCRWPASSWGSTASTRPRINSDWTCAASFSLTFFFRLKNPLYLCDTGVSGPHDKHRTIGSCRPVSRVMTRFSFARLHALECARRNASNVHERSNPHPLPSPLSGFTGCAPSPMWSKCCWRTVRFVVWSLFRIPLRGHFFESSSDLAISCPIVRTFRAHQRIMLLQTILCHTSVVNLRAPCTFLLTQSSTSEKDVFFQTVFRHAFVVILRAPRTSMLTQSRLERPRTQPSGAVMDALRLLPSHSEIFEHEGVRPRDFLRLASAQADPAVFIAVFRYFDDRSVALK
jgi:hypothetical protein